LKSSQFYRTQDDIHVQCMPDGWCWLYSLLLHLRIYDIEDDNDAVGKPITEEVLGIYLGMWKGSCPRDLSLPKIIDLHKSLGIPSPIVTNDLS